MKRLPSRSKKLAAETLALRTTVVDPPFRLRGPAVQGRPGERFVYLRMGAYAGQAGIAAGWRAKIGLEGISRKLLTEVRAKHSGILEVQFAGTAPKGGPACASVPLLGTGWHVA